MEVADEEQVAPEHLAVASAPTAEASSGGGGDTVTAAVQAPQALQPVSTAAAPPDGSVAPPLPVATLTVTSTSTTVTASAPKTMYGSNMSGSPADVAPAPPTVVSTPPVATAATGGSVAPAVHASPAVRALARELGLDLSAVSGSGPGGRVTKADLSSYKDSLARPPGAAAAAASASAGGGADAVGPMAASATPAGELSLTELLAQYQKLTAASAAAAATTVSGTPAAAGGTAGGSSVVPLRGYRRAMVKAMTAAASVPLFHLHDEVVCDRLLAVREVLRGDPGLQAQGVRLTVLPLMLKALSAALLQHPHINASLAPNGTDLLVHPAHNIGVAMATPSGLVVPNIKQVQRKSVAQVASELALLQRLAAAGRVPQEALAGGTISVSNIGTVGGTYATPLVSPPEVAIVALGRMQLLPRYPSQGAAAAAQKHQQHHHQHHHQQPLLQPVSILPISWGADHRVVDGAALAAFSNSWKALLEQPERLLLTTA